MKTAPSRLTITELREHKTEIEPVRGRSSDQISRAYNTLKNDTNLEAHMISAKEEKVTVDKVEQKRHETSETLRREEIEESRRDYDNHVRGAREKMERIRERVEEVSGGRRLNVDGTATSSRRREEFALRQADRRSMIWAKSKPSKKKRRNSSLGRDSRQLIRIGSRMKKQRWSVRLQRSRTRDGQSMKFGSPAEMIVRRRQGEHLNCQWNNI
ncbi:hypothetical protein BKA64DRAFT_644389 [Cadophora sp. MPI-SDFR-AT-0126]|nr:hypothetical protein BKA64DRAFT_644389 [Leotiomycetes sp. MPI-SDFR-AT-0126]